VPPGFEAAFFALYAVTDKGSSVFGPAIVGAITDATGEIRPVGTWFVEEHDRLTDRTGILVSGGSYCSSVSITVVRGCGSGQA
jgi:hypothetical protein